MANQLRKKQFLTIFNAGFRLIIGLRIRRFRLEINKEWETFFSFRGN